MNRKEGFSKHKGRSHGPNVTRLSQSAGPVCNTRLSTTSNMNIYLLFSEGTFLFAILSRNLVFCFSCFNINRIVKQMKILHNNNIKKVDIFFIFLCILRSIWVNKWLFFDNFNFMKICHFSKRFTIDNPMSQPI